MSQFPTRVTRKNIAGYLFQPASRGVDVFYPLALAAILLVATAAYAQSAKGGKTDSKPDSKDSVSRLRIEVTGGDQSKPVADASVYVKFSEDRKILKDKHIELSLKTNEQGITRSPEIPTGKTLIQVIAPGWKTYGEWFDVNQSEQTIAIHLVRPVKPY